MPQIPKNQTAGVLWFIAHCFLFSVISVISKHLIANLHVFEILFFQTSIGTLFLIPIILRKKKIPQIKSVHIHFLRSALWVAASALFFYSIKFIQIPRAMALSFAVPLFTSIMAIFFLKEVFHWRRAAALIVGFIGMIVIIQPGMESFKIMTLLVVLAAFFWSITDIMIKVLSRDHDVMVNTLLFSFFSALCTLPLAVYFWKTPDLSEMLWLLALAFVFVINMMTVKKSYERADLTIIMPFAFTQLIFSAVMAYFAFGQVVRITTIIGSAIIIASTSYIAYREKKVQGRVVVKGLEG